MELSARVACIDAVLDSETGESFYSVGPARTYDVSDQGLAFTSHEALSPGARVLVELDLPDGRVLAMNGRVVWSQPAAGLLSRFAVELSEPHLGLVQATDDAVAPTNADDVALDAVLASLKLSMERAGEPRHMRSRGTLRRSRRAYR